MGKVRGGVGKIVPPRIVHIIVHTPQNCQNLPERPKISRLRKNMVFIGKKMVTLGLKVTKNFRVGAEGFEPSTFCTPSKRATSLRYAPKKAVRNQMGILLNWSERYHVVGGAVNGVSHAFDRYNCIICLQLVPNKIFSIVFRCTCSSIG